MNTVRALIWLLVQIECALQSSTGRVVVRVMPSARKVWCMTGRYLYKGAEPKEPEFCHRGKRLAGNQTCDVCLKMRSTYPDGTNDVAQMCKAEYDKFQLETKGILDLPAAQCGKAVPEDKVKKGHTIRFDCCKQGEKCNFSKGTVAKTDSEQCKKIKGMVKKAQEEVKQELEKYGGKTCMAGSYMYQGTEPEQPEFCPGQQKPAGLEICDTCLKFQSTGPDGTTHVAQGCKADYEEARLKEQVVDLPAAQCGKEVPAHKLKKGYKMRFDCCKKGEACDFSKGTVGKSDSPQCEKVKERDEKVRKKIEEAINGKVSSTAAPFLIACALLLLVL